MSAIKWAGPGTLIIPRRVLAVYVDLLPPEVEMRALSILRVARYENVWLTVGEGPLQVTEADLQAILVALADEAPPRPVAA